jgi:hypothetical protein
VTSPDERTTVRWRIAAMVSPEIVALVLTIIVTAVAVAVFLGRLRLPF